MDWYSYGADIWSLGCVLAFYCNRGLDLFSSYRDVLRWDGLPTDPCPIGGSFSAGLITLLRSMLTKDPTSRPAGQDVKRESSDGQ